MSFYRDTSYIQLGAHLAPGWHHLPNYTYSNPQMGDPEDSSVCCFGGMLFTCLTCVIPAEASTLENPGFCLNAPSNTWGLMGFLVHLTPAPLGDPSKAPAFMV